MEGHDLGEASRLAAATGAYLCFDDEAGLACYKPGARSRFFYRARTHRGRKGERRSLPEADYASLVTAAHNQLHAPMTLIWDNLNTHISAAMRAFIEAHPGWLTEARLPAYAPDLNAAEGAWSNMKNGLGNLSTANVDQLNAIIKNRLKSIQYRPTLIDGFLAQTGLSLEPEPPQTSAFQPLQTQGQNQGGNSRGCHKGRPQCVRPDALDDPDGAGGTADDLCGAVPRLASQSCLSSHNNRADSAGRRRHAVSDLLSA